MTIDEKPGFSSDQQEGLHRDLDTRHLAMIALGGTIGTGIFVGTGLTVYQAGPMGVLIAYSVVAVLVYSVIAAVGEMSTQVPISGAFGELSSRFVHPAVGFTLGWNYYLQWLLTITSEIAVFGGTPSYWFPDIPSLWFTVGGLILMFLLNLCGVKLFGEIEYWMSIVKIAAIVIFVFIGFLVICGVNRDAPIGFENWKTAEDTGDGPRPGLFTSTLGVFGVFANAFYAYGGTEMIGVTAGEAKNPSVTVPRAIKLTFWLIVSFYLFSLLIIGLIIPSNDPGLKEEAVVRSPFTRTLQLAGIPYAPDIMNAVILVAVFSAASGAIYCSTRTLQSLAENGMAPLFLVKTTKSGVPLNSLIISMAFGAIALVGNYVGDGTVFNFLVNVLSISVLLCWCVILVTHLRFRWGWRMQGRQDSELVCCAPFYPYFDIIGLLIAAVILVAFLVKACSRPFDYMQDSTLYVGVPLFFIVYFVYIGYLRIKGKSLELVRWQDMDFESTNSAVQHPKMDKEMHFKQ